MTASVDDLTELLAGQNYLADSQLATTLYLALVLAKPVLLEPVMRVEVVVPDEYMGSVNGNLISRRGELEGTEILGSTHIIKAMVPLSEMFGYATELRSRTQGRGAFTMHFGKYVEVPRNIAEEIVSKAQGKVAS